MVRSRRWLALAMMAAPLGAQEIGPSAEKAREAKAQYERGVAAMNSEALDEAADAFAAAARADPDMLLAHYNLGQCRMAQKRYVEAMHAYRATKDAFGHLQNLSEKDREARERERADEIRALQDALQRLHLLKDGSAERRTAEMETRIRVLEGMKSKGRERTPMPAEYPLALGSAYFRQQRLDEARAEYEEAIRLNSRLGAAHNNLAVIHLLQGRPQEAQAEVRAARASGFRVDPRLERDIDAALHAPPGR